MSALRSLGIGWACVLVLGATAAPAAGQGDPHAGHQPPPSTSPAAGDAPHVHPGAESDVTTRPSFIPPITDADRKAAFPDVAGHAVHDAALTYFVLLDRLEWQRGDSNGVTFDSGGWLGGNRNRLWFRAEGDFGPGGGDGDAHVFYGRQVSRWWDLVAGVRQDVGAGPNRTWAAVGLQGLAPYWFEVEATLYLGTSGRTQARVEVEYELLVTNRVILQPRLELQVAGRSDPSQGIGAGLNTTDAGLRLRYEIKRELAPYVGIDWTTRWGQTADFATAAGERRSEARVVTGLRLWF